MVTLRPHRKDAELEKYRVLQEGAIRKLYDRGLTIEEIGDVLGVPSAHIPPLLANRTITEEVSEAWIIALDRYFGVTTDKVMLERLLAVTFHTYSQPPVFWYQFSPDGGGKVLMRLYQGGYIVKDEYQQVLDRACFVLIPRSSVQSVGSER